MMLSMNSQTLCSIPDSTVLTRKVLDPVHDFMVFDKNM